LLTADGWRSSSWTPEHMVINEATF